MGNSNRKVSTSDKVAKGNKILKMMFIYSTQSPLSMTIKERIISKDVIMVSVDNKDMRTFLSDLKLGKGAKIVKVPSLIICYANNMYKVITDEELLEMCR